MINAVKEFIEKCWEFIFGPESVLAEPGYDPTLEPRRRAHQRTRWLVLLAVIGIPLLLCVGAIAVVRAQMNEPISTFTPSPSPTFDPIGALQALPAPGLVITEGAVLPTETITTTPAMITMDSILTKIAGGGAPTATAENFLTQQVHDNVNRTATIAALGVGTPVNVSGISPQETIIYVYPTIPPTAWVITQTPSWTPWIITTTPSVTPYPTYTAFPTQTFTPYPTYTQYPTYTAVPTQTAWIIITSPPIATVIITQEVTREVTVVVTATPSETPTPSPTP